MNQHDPFEALEKYYVGLQLAEPDDLLGRVYLSRGSSSRRLLAGTCGFTVALVLTTSLLVWASRPATPSASGAAALSRYQMVKAGLADRDFKPGAS